MIKKLKIVISLLILSPLLLIFGCGTINVSGKTFKYSKVTIDWGIATEENKKTIYAENQVANEAEFLNVLKTRSNRNSRFTTFGTDNKYTTKNSENEVLDSGYYKQDETVITLAESEDKLNEAGAFTLLANAKGYIVTVKINDEWKVFAKYQYTEQE